MVLQRSAITGVQWGPLIVMSRDPFVSVLVGGQWQNVWYGGTDDDAHRIYVEVRDWLVGS